MAYFTVKKDPSGYRARLFGNNNELVWWTEAYVNKASAQNAITIAQQTSSSTAVKDQT